MANFQGWLLKFGEVILPNSFLLADGWEATPNQRLEIDAYRDANQLLHRETGSNTKSKITITIRDLTLQEMEALKNVIGLATLPAEDKKQRRVRATYWNDEELAYTSGVFYMPDITYQIHTIEQAPPYGIEYGSFKVTLIEY